jgi:hypothetical protein
VTGDRRMKRRFAHELYPHPTGGETRPLSVEVPYLYARMVGLDVTDTGWSQVEPRTTAGDRITEYINTARIALLADALEQGKTGDEAWAWADQRVTDDMECAWERAHEVLGIEHLRGAIKPYPCGPEPQRHWHYGPPSASGTRLTTLIDGTESACDECTEPPSGCAS